MGLCGQMSSGRGGGRWACAFRLLCFVSGKRLVRSHVSSFGNVIV
jgi:hypothetical protein